MLVEEGVPPQSPAMNELSTSSPRPRFMRASREFSRSAIIRSILSPPFALLVGDRDLEDLVDFFLFFLKFNFLLETTILLVDVSFLHSSN